MCGAFAILHPFKEVGRQFNAGYNDLDLPPRYNARPGQKLPVILNSTPQNVCLALWGITPSWSNGKAIINTRKESLDTKVMFADSFKNRRCVIPADAFYEWAVINGKKIPYLFRMKTKSIFGFAGLWQQDAKTKEPSFTIITTEPNKLVSKIHDRMPAILLPHKEKEWLNGEANPALLENLLNPYPENLMEAYPVSPAVNSSKNDFPEIIKPV
jgi:putative SOS response-associated peptidase YedK